MSTKLAEVRLAEAVRRHSIGAHGRGQQKGFHRHVKGAGVLIGGVVEIGERGGIERWAQVGGDSERGECGLWDNPGGNAGCKALPQERAKRLVFPGLDVSGRPVVEEGEAEDVRVGLADGNGFSERVAFGDVDADFEFVVEEFARTEIRSGGGIRGLRLAARAADCGSANDD